MYKTLNTAVFNDNKNECTRLVPLIYEWLEEKGFKNNNDAYAYTLTLKYDSSVEDEGYIFAPLNNGAAISASCLSGLYAGAGHFLLTVRIKDGGLLPSEEYKVSTPQKKMRGMYFATHFHNFYNDAPISEVQRYVEEMALWGYNSFSAWFDMHHYTGIDDPKAVQMISRLRMIFETARNSGMKLYIGGLANEGFSSTPEMLKADWHAGQNGYHSEPMGHYHVEICPNAPGGMELILNNREEVLKAFEGIEFDYVSLWPYDQGGCTCEKCAPWGANGFLKTAYSLIGLYRKYYPNSRFILSTWYFDSFVNGETAAFKKKFKNEGNYVSYILSEPHGPSGELTVRDKEICNLPIIGFPEISMYNAIPWGGYGANPIPRRIRQIWDVCASEMQGGTPYSEGIYEDVNKFIISRLYWYGDYDITAALHEYSAAYFSEECADDIAECLSKMEISLLRGIMFDERYIDPYSFGASEYLKPGTQIVIHDPEPCKYIYDLVIKCNAALPPATRNTWRWRIIYLRAVIDNELSSNNYKETEVCRKAYDELIDIYHAQNADYVVRPPVTQK